MERGGPRGSYPASYPSAPTSRALDLQTEGSNSSIATIMASAVSPTANVAPSVLENDSSDEYHTSATFRETRQFRMTQRAKDVLLDDMYTMFLERDKYGADFKFKVGQRVFKCHKAILMVRLKTYCSSWSEKVGVIILPKDFESEAMEAFFLFLYTAKVPNNFSQLALSILPIAVYFSCEELIGKCELDLVSNLASDNVVTVLDVARRQFRDHLQYKAAKFIKKNIDSVRKTDSYKRFLDSDETNSRVLLDIVTQTLKRPTSVSSMPGSPSPPPYETNDQNRNSSNRFSLAENSECFLPL